MDEYFAAHQTEFEHLQLAQLLVERDDLARELASQVRDEGRSLEEVAREQGLRVAHHQLLRRHLSGPLAEALATAATGELVGPVGTPQGFALVLIEERRQPELDPPTRQRIQDELFENWLATRLREAKLDLATCG